MEVWKLLTEDSPFGVLENFIVESKGGSKDYMVRGPFMVLNTVNANKRVYLESALMPAIDEYMPRVNSFGAYGEINHPQSTTVDLDRACLRISKLHRDKNNILGEAKVLSTPKGKVIRCLMDDNCRWGVSSRGLGTLEESGDHKNVTKYKLIAIDAVANPSGPGCYASPILENKDYILEGGNFVELERFSRSYEILENDFSKYPVGGRDAYKVEAVKRFLRDIKFSNK